MVGVRGFEPPALPPEGSDLSEKPLKLRRRLHAKGPEWTGEDWKGPSFSTFSAHPHHPLVGNDIQSHTSHRFIRFCPNY